MNLSDNDKLKLIQLHDVARDMAVWIVTGVCGFLAWNVWSVSHSVERLVVEIKHVALQDLEYKQEISNVHDEIASIRREQNERSVNGFEIAQIKNEIELMKGRIQSMLDRLNEFLNTRWREDTEKRAGPNKSG